ncbi:MAG: GWxTD domain-containing protein [bacterium]|nr:GWxTD domain-containing protein [bacterium]
MRMQNRHGRPLLLAGFLFSAACGAMAQPAEIRFSRDEDVPDFHFDTAITASPDSGKSRFNCFVKVAYDELQFVRDGGGYIARFELSAILFNDRGEQVEAKIRSHEVRVPGYDSTNSRSAFAPAQASFDIAPGRYELLLSVMDLDSRKASVKKTPVQISKGRPGDLTVTDIILAERVVADSAGNPSPMASVLGNLSETMDTLFVWFEIHSPPSLASVPIRVRLTDVKGAVVRSDTLSKTLSGGRTVCVLSVGKGDLRGGRYKLDVEVGSGERIVKRSRPLTVHWGDMPGQAADLDKMIEQIRYIAKGSEIKKIKKKQGEDRLEAFREFWRQRDPTPDTEANELEEEYYRRVEFANQNFGTFIDGWKSDRGMVYILLGPPGEVERHPFESGSKPYEIWTYYTFNRSVLFVDHTGMGDYRLEGTIHDLLSRIR